MNKILILCAAALLGTAELNAQTYLECDFSGGIPTDFTLIDGDQLTPSRDMQNLGFEVGTPWVAYTPKGEDGPVACSTSWYMEAGTSDDWMILPALTIADDHVVLRWRAMASDKKHRDGYVVYATTDVDAADLKAAQWQPLLTVDKEENTWTLHNLDLAAYKGQAVRLAFVNNSTDQSRLYVDDVFVGVKADLQLKLVTGTGVPNNGQVAFSGTVTNLTEAAIPNYTIGLSYGGETYTQQIDEPLASGASAAFTLDQPIPLPFHEQVAYTIWADNGNSRHTVESTVTSYPRHVVCEEGTGTWCGWCVRGHVALEYLHEHCSDWTIGIAAHNGDPMANEYEGLLSSYKNSGYPSGTCNRIVRTDPGDFEMAARKAFNTETVLVAMQAEASLNTETREVSTTTQLWFAEGQQAADYRIGFSIIENNVHVPDDPGYDQNNSYSGSSTEMGGYENLPGNVPAAQMWYQEVARGFVENFKGVSGSIPASFEAEEEITYSKSFTLPDGILDDRNTAVVIMVIDQADGHIINALQLPLGENEINGIENAVQPTATSSAALYDLSGRRVTGTPTRGIYIQNGRKMVIK